jgi:UDP-3-O-[3-hydroxymyristoyl] N-acetylglucosamine deacetylase
MAYRRTLRREVSCTGIGLHSGRPVRLRLLPAPAEHGIRFVRADVGVEIPATLAHIGEQDHATTLQRDGVSIGTVEHLLAALSGLGVDDARVEVDGPEVPVLDGSAAPFVILLHEAGLRPLAVPRRYLKVKEPVAVVHGSKAARLVPADHFEVVYSIGFDHPLLRHQALSMRVTPAASPRPSLRRARSASCARWRCCARAASPSAAASRTRW